MTRQRSSVTSAVTRFGVAGLVAVAALGGLVLFAVSRISTTEALRSAQERGRLAGHGIIEPALNDALMETSAGGQQARDALDEIVQARVLSERVLRVKIWTVDAKILYSDEPRLVGKQYAPKDDHQKVVQTGEVSSELANTASPENIYERDSGRMLEVYLPMRMPDGTFVVYEQYERYDSVVGNANRLVRRLALPLGAGLLLLWLTQLPLARSLAKRMHAAEAERIQLLEHAVTASSRERERIAADLHDGAVQELAGLTFELAAASAREPAGPSQEAFERSAVIARKTMQRLRSSLVDLHPPTVDALGLDDGIESLAQTLREGGVEVAVNVELNDLDEDRAALVYRVAQELIRNVEEHANASKASVRGWMDGSVAKLVITDNGVGFDDNKRADRREEGHLGLELQAALAKRSGGTLLVESQPGHGTVATVEVPK
jgi:two-component system, NarL family, sensor kinase